ncbi:hypothetical protein RRG08_014864 [Elysia crispata]|uniref:Uncharacterized protein n=1 Tax=Elysia crispata TaxID=231223 RepID=A0AAE1E1R4_9GAST|nr:hypothetical protein RRG08_014864 [Elysia crispata]
MEGDPFQVGHVMVEGRPSPSPPPPPFQINGCSRDVRHPRSTLLVGCAVSSDGTRACVIVTPDPRYWLDGLSRVTGRLRHWLDVLSRVTGCKCHTRSTLVGCAVLRDGMCTCVSITPDLCYWLDLLSRVTGCKCHARSMLLVGCGVSRRRDVTVCKCHGRSTLLVGCAVSRDGT